MKKPIYNYDDPNDLIQTLEEREPLSKKESEVRDNFPSAKIGIRITDWEGHCWYHRPAPLGEPLVELRGLNVGVFVSYLCLHWPNHRTVAAFMGDVLGLEILRDETLADISQDIELSETDLDELTELAALTITARFHKLQRGANK